MLGGTIAKMFAWETEKPLEILCNIALTQAYTHTARTRPQRRRRLEAWQTKSGGMPLGFMDA